MAYFMVPFLDFHAGTLGK